MSPEVSNNGGYNYQHIGQVGIGRAEDVKEGAEIPAEERRLRGILERILWEKEHQSPSELIDTLVLKLRCFVARHIDLASKERVENGRWVVLQSIPSTLNPDKKISFLMKPVLNIEDEYFFKMVPEEQVVRSREPVLV